MARNGPPNLPPRPGYAGASPITPNALGRPDRTIATGAPPGSSTGEGEINSDIFTIITQVGMMSDGKTPTLYNGDRNWAKVTVMLETAGIVVVGTRASLDPVASGKGYELQTNVPREFVIAKGNRLYYLASAVNRVAVSIEPLPWLEQITARTSQVVQTLAAMFKR